MPYVRVRAEINKVTATSEKVAFQIQEKRYHTKSQMCQMLTIRKFFIL